MCVAPRSIEFYTSIQRLHRFTQIIEAGAATGESYLFRGGCYQEQQMLDAAIQDYTKGLEYSGSLDDETIGILYDSRGMCYQRTHRPEQALADSKQAVKHNPTESRAWANLGRTYHSMGNYEEALKAFATCIDINPQDTWVWYFRAQTYEALGQPENIISDVTTLMALDVAKTAILYNTRARAHLALGHYDAVIADCNAGLQPETLERDLEAWALFAVRGWAYFYLGKLEDALADFMDSIRLDQKAAHSRLGIGLVYKAMGAESGA
ncbi:MAG: tetratricopeptide repeat protein, partial [Chitinophagaceae bacterium]|nr:tetratricopeptide repeat protein [Anaerolineae bacterium]